MNPSNADLPQLEVCPTILRNAYNCAKYDEEVARDDLRRRARPRNPRKRGGNPDGDSRTWELVDRNDAVIAIEHQRRRPEGWTGYVYDPKWLRAGDVALIVPRRKESHSCPVCRTTP